ncbi:CvpA family protein [Ruminococcus albus]|uniref:Colicin V production protein n=1 Tax=Ruminococcus albus (strain ATCC 27210 / DSM 20455 / JCM 14654 / NCDO 2250 / 7) TaxID=697329 RepID=E6UBA2_RUMA7|nr:CvpA family protein [Ruminococcus albus]ADU21452.1 hypothetical protein Rumal_0926 [Ruminococcus albus 7 = DSM 20455]
MALLLDIAVMLIMVVTCIAGYIKGFRRYIVGMIAAVIATVGASVFSEALAEPVYDRYMHDRVKTHVMRAIEDADPKQVVMDKLAERGYGQYFTEDEIGEAVQKGGDITDNVSGLMKSKGLGDEAVGDVDREIDSYFDNELPEEIGRQLDKAGYSGYFDRIKISSEDMHECVKRAATQSREDAADFIVEKAVSPLFIGMIRCLLFVITYLVLILLIKLITAIAGALDGEGEEKAADRFAGLLLGAVKGLMYCAVIAWALSKLCRATRDSLSVFNSGMLEQSYLFIYFFDFFYG